MKKIYTLIAGFIMFGAFVSKGQDTLLYEGFQFVMDSYLTHTINPPPGVVSDSMWYNYDADQLSDGSGSPTPRKDDWFQSMSFSDSNLYVPGTVLDTNIVMASNSWFSAPGKADNWLITRNIQLGAHDTLFWKSAPRQTPRYLDGYQVLISSTNNSDISFHDTLFTAAEMTQIVGNNDSIFSGYKFSN